MEAVPMPAPHRRALPEEVLIDGDNPPRHTPNEVRLLKQMTGKTFTDLAGETADFEDQEQVMAWMQLRRDGYEPTWDEVGDMLIQVVKKPEDPTNGGS